MGLRGYDNPRQFSDLLSGQDCTLRKIVEGIFHIGIAIHSRYICASSGFNSREFLTHEPVHACSIAVALGMGKMREHFRYRKAAGRWLPFGTFDGRHLRSVWRRL
jgi:hypothetical protein